MRRKRAPVATPSCVRLGRVWLAVAVTQMGWLSAVGKVRGGLHPSARAVTGKAIPGDKAATPLLLSWSVYVGNLDIGENHEARTKEGNSSGTLSMSEILYKKGIRRV